jgi:hypothetical protein
MKPDGPRSPLTGTVDARALAITCLAPSDPRRRGGQLGGRQRRPVGNGDYLWGASACAIDRELRSPARRMKTLRVVDPEAQPDKGGLGLSDGDDRRR